MRKEKTFDNGGTLDWAICGLLKKIGEIHTRVDELLLTVDDNYILLKKRIDALCEYLGGDFKVLPAKPEKVVFVVKDKVVDGQKDGS